MGFKFESLIIWQKSMDYGEEIYLLSRKFPADERFNLVSQICRAADSIALNISEGSILQSDAEFRKFLGYSIRSLAETVTCLHKAKRRNYIGDEMFENMYLEAFNLKNMIIGFRNKVK
jgi:four helix bundle protein